MSFVSSSGMSRPIIAELMLHCFIRFISGGSYLDVRLVAQMSVASFYRCIQLRIVAIGSCRDLLIRFEIGDAWIVVIIRFSPLERFPEVPPDDDTGALARSSTPPVSTRTSSD